jgi:hypothetical protein
MNFVCGVKKWIVGHKKGILLTTAVGGAIVYCANAYLKSLPDHLAEQFRQFQEEEKGEFFNLISHQPAVDNEFSRFIAAYEETISPIPTAEQIGATTRSLTTPEKQQFWEELKVLSMTKESFKFSMIQYNC